MVIVVQLQFKAIDDRSRILYVGESRSNFSLGRLEVAHAVTVSEAIQRLGQERFSVLVVDRSVASAEDVKRLAHLDSEMYVLVGASEPNVSPVVVFANDCEADGIVGLPLSRSDVAAAVERAFRLGSRVAHCVKLYELSRSLLCALKQRDLVKTVLEIAPRVIPAESAALFLLSAFCESHAAFECHATETPSHEVRGLLAEVTAIVSRRGATASNDDVDGEMTLPANYRWLACPLLGAAGAGGAVVFLRGATADPFSAQERQAATTFAATVASALENSRDFRELESKVRTLTRDRERVVAREAVSIARDLGGAVAHEVTNAMTVVASNVDALAAAAQDQELWRVAKEAAEYLLLQGEPTGQRIASRIMDAGGGRNTDGLVTEIAGMIDECLEGVRRVSEMARTLGHLQLPPPRQATSFEVSELLRAPTVTEAVVHRPVVFRNTSAKSLVAAKSDIEEALASVLRALDLEAFALEPEHSRELAPPLVVRVEDSTVVSGGCTVTVDAPVPVGNRTALQSLLAPRLRVQKNVFRLDASLAFAHALLGRNGLDLWVEERSDGGVSLVISASDSAA